MEWDGSITAKTELSNTKNTNLRVYKNDKKVTFLRRVVNLSLVQEYGYERSGFLKRLSGRNSQPSIDGQMVFLDMLTLDTLSSAIQVHPDRFY